MSEASIISPSTRLAMQICAICFKNISNEELDDPEAIYRQVTSWVHGPKLQSPVLREQTGRIAHRDCIHKVLDGQSPDQSSIPGLEPT